MLRVNNVFFPRYKVNKELNTTIEKEILTKVGVVGRNGKNRNEKLMAEEEDEENQG